MQNWKWKNRLLKNFKWVCLLLCFATLVEAQNAAEAPEERNITEAPKEKNLADSSQVACESVAFQYNFQKNSAFNPTTFKNPIYIELYNVEKKQLWAPPLRNTQIKTSNFGPRWGHFHHGVDLALPMGEPVFAVFNGVIKLSMYGKGYGNYVIIKHDNGLETLYAHLSKRSVKAGQRVKAGQMIGAVGSTGYSTGPHLHFEVHYQGYTLNPMLLYDFKNPNQLRGDKFFIKPHHFRHYGNATPKKGYLFHEVGQNESLEAIATRYKVTAEDLIRLNQLQSTKLNAGQIIQIR